MITDYEEICYVYYILNYTDSNEWHVFRAKYLQIWHCLASQCLAGVHANSLLLAIQVS